MHVYVSSMNLNERQTSSWGSQNTDFLINTQLKDQYVTHFSIRLLNAMRKLLPYRSCKRFPWWVVNEECRLIKIILVLYILIL